MKYMYGEPYLLTYLLTCLLTYLLTYCVLELKNEASKPTYILEDEGNIEVLQPNFKTL